MIERALVVSTGAVLGPQHLPDLRPTPNRDIRTPQRRSTPDKPSLGIRERLESALHESEGNRQQTALLLKWSVPTVYRKVKKYQLSHLLKRPRD